MDSRSRYTGCLILPDIAILQASFEYWISSADTSPVNVAGRDLNAWAIVFVPLSWQASWLLVLGRGLARVFWLSRGKREIRLAPPMDSFHTHQHWWSDLSCRKWGPSISHSTHWPLVIWCLLYIHSKKPCAHSSTPLLQQLAILKFFFYLSPQFGFFLHLASVLL